MKTPIILENKAFFKIEKQLQQFGSVLNLFQFFFSELPEDDYEFSKYVAKEAIKVLMDRNAVFYEELDKRYQSQRFLEQGLYGPNRKREIDGNVEPTGKIISIQNFLGDAYSLEKKEIISHPNNGLSYTLLNPPYGMRYEKFVQEKARELGRKKLKAARLQTAKTKFFNYALGEIGLDVENENQYVIHSWSDDWCSYFEDGKEWWGTFFWTILNKEKGEITVIGASTTD